MACASQTISRYGCDARYEQFVRIDRDGCQPLLERVLAQGFNDRAVVLQAVRPEILTHHIHHALAQRSTPRQGTRHRLLLAQASQAIVLGFLHCLLSTRGAPWVAFVNSLADAEGV